MRRRDFIKILGAGSALFSLSPQALAMEEAAQWNSYRLRYRVTLPESPAPARLWVPLPEVQETSYQKSMASLWNGKADKAEIVTLPAGSVTMLYAEWHRSGPRTLEVSTIVKTRDRKVDLTRYQPSRRASLPPEVRAFLKPSRHIPTDGIVKSTALSITKAADTPLEKAQAIYDWIVDNTFRDPKVRGCGLGNVKFMLESGNLGGKCADISALFVGLARAAGIPARDVYGIRVDNSRQFKSLGKYGDVTGAQHCRAEFYLAGLGWVPVDPADVRKVVLEEGLRLDDPRVVAFRKRAFGSWEMNWVAFNHGADVALTPHTAHNRLPFFMYPYAELAGTPRDSLDAPRFEYQIQALELVGTGIDLKGLTYGKSS